MANNYVAIDVETTGLRAKYDKIIEIGAIKVENSCIVDTYSTFVNPSMQLSEFIRNLTQINQEELDKAPYIETIMKEFLDFLGEVPLLGHNLSFDYAFLKKAAVQSDCEFQKMGIDTLQLARKYLPHEPSKKLENLCQSLGIVHRAHRALDDAKAAHELYQILQERWTDVPLQEPRRLQFDVKKEAPASTKNKDRLQSLITKHHLEVSYKVDGLTKNQVSRYTDQILAEFGR